MSDAPYRALLALPDRAIRLYLGLLALHDEELPATVENLTALPGISTSRKTLERARRDLVAAGILALEPWRLPREEETARRYHRQADALLLADLVEGAGTPPDLTVIDRTVLELLAQSRYEALELAVGYCTLVDEKPPTPHVCEWLAALIELYGPDPAVRGLVATRTVEHLGYLWSHRYQRAQMYAARFAGYEVGVPASSGQIQNEPPSAIGSP